VGFVQPGSPSLRWRPGERSQQGRQNERRVGRRREEQAEADSNAQGTEADVTRHRMSQAVGSTSKGKKEAKAEEARGEQSWK